MKGSSKIYFHNKNTLSLKHKIHNQPQITPIRLQCRPRSSLSTFKQRNQVQFNSIEKENKSKINNTKAFNTPSKTKQPLRLKTYTTNTNSKPTINSVKIQQRENIQVNNQHQQNEFIETNINEIVSLLKKNYILTQNHISSYTISKDHLFRLLKFIIQRNICEYSEFPYLDNVIFQVNKRIEQHKLFHKKQKIKTISMVNEYQFSKEDYYKGIKIKENEIQLLIQRQQKLVQSINHLLIVKPRMQQEYARAQKGVNENKRIIEESNAEVINLQKKQQFLRQQMQKITNEMTKIKKEFQNIQNFINTQNNQLIIMASEQYKNIQTDIYDYASYLQCNQLASSLTYEPLSITCITEKLQEEIKNINRTLIQNQKIDTKEKGRMMRDFLMQWMNKFKKKDEQTKQMMTFKTKCIKNFIQKMQKWMQNYTFKQEYLGNLKKQFVVSSENMAQLLKQLTSPHFCELCRAILQPLYSKIADTYEKLETNYKLGNSFY